jgi:hypothetical protein
MEVKMAHKRFFLLAVILFSTALVSAETKIYDHPGKVSKLLILADEGKETISRDIYGHFSEHLGRCIYDGFWVGPDSSIPLGIKKRCVSRKIYLHLRCLFRAG